MKKKSYWKFQSRKKDRATQNWANLHLDYADALKNLYISKPLEKWAEIIYDASNAIFVSDLIKTSLYHILQDELHLNTQLSIIRKVSWLDYNISHLSRNITV